MAQQFYEPSRPCLLGLPTSIRRRIYWHLGMARWDGLPFLFNLKGSVNPIEQVAFHGLLLSCRAVYVETSALLFSTSSASTTPTKSTRRSSHCGISPLRRLHH
jgi:hypothetical protein